MNQQPFKNDKLRWVERISKLMDEQFSIKGYRFGLDPILNFIPYFGDLASFSVSLALIATMLKNGASKKVALKMFGNVLIDTILGAIPVLGFFFDFGFKANSRNIKLLREHYTEGKHTGSITGIIIGFLLIAVVVLGLIAIALYYLFAYLYTLIQNWL